MGIGQGVCYSCTPRWLFRWVCFKCNIGFQSSRMSLGIIMSTNFHCSTHSYDHNCWQSTCSKIFRHMYIVLFVVFSCIYLIVYIYIYPIGSSHFFTVMLCVSPHFTICRSVCSTKTFHVGCAYPRNLIQ